MTGKLNKSIYSWVFYLLLFLVILAVFYSFSGWLAFLLGILTGFILTVGISYLEDLSIPGISSIFKKHYHYLQSKLDWDKPKLLKRKKLNYWLRQLIVLRQKAYIFYLNLLCYFISLFSASEESLKEFRDWQNRLSKKSSIGADLRGLKNKKEVQKTYNYFLKLYRQEQRKTVLISITGSVIAIIVSLTISVMYPAVFETKAATYNFVQTEWGSADTDASADHDNNQTGLTTFYSKSNITIGTDLTITRESN